eukprot:scaffold6798_cov108-Isochrysis_galbana.AAC.3
MVPGGRRAHRICGHPAADRCWALPPINRNPLACRLLGKGQSVDRAQLGRMVVDCLLLASTEG